MLKSKRYLYVGFMCHQTIEKMLKAIYSYKIQEMPPRIHNLARLVKLTKLDNEISEELLNIIHELNPLNIAIRYPDQELEVDRKSTRLNSSHVRISYAVFCLK